MSAQGYFADSGHEVINQGIVFLCQRSPKKDNFTQPLSFKEILGELEISKDDYYRSLSISEDEDIELNLKRGTDSCFVKNYFDVDLNLGRQIWTYDLFLISIRL